MFVLNHLDCKCKSPATKNGAHLCTWRNARVLKHWSSPAHFKGSWAYTSLFQTNDIQQPSRGKKNKLDDKHARLFLPKKQPKFIKRGINGYVVLVSTTSSISLCIFCRLLILHDLYSHSPSSHCCISPVAVLLDVHQALCVLLLNCVTPHLLKLVLFPPEGASWGKKEKEWD